MEGRDGRRNGLRLAWVGAAWLTTAPPAALAEEPVTNVRLVNNSHRFAVARALANAARQLDHAECQGLLDEFKPLRVSRFATALPASD